MSLATPSPSPEPPSQEQQKKLQLIQAATYLEAIYTYLRWGRMIPLNDITLKYLLKNTNTLNALKHDFESKPLEEWANDPVVISFTEHLHSKEVDPQLETHFRTFVVRFQESVAARIAHIDNPKQITPYLQEQLYEVEAANTIHDRRKREAAYNRIYQNAQKAQEEKIIDSQTFMLLASLLLAVWGIGMPQVWMFMSGWGVFFDPILKMAEAVPFLPTVLMMMGKNLQFTIAGRAQQIINSTLATIYLGIDWIQTQLL